MKKLALISTLLTISATCNILLAQSRSGNAYEFIDMPTSSRQTALGGAHAVLGADDLNFAIHNPAALRDSMHNSIGLNFTPLKAGIKSGSVAYARRMQQIDGILMVGVQYINYGSFDQTDEIGTEIGTFTAQEVAVNFIYSHSFSHNYTMAATFKPIYSKLAEYNSFGLAMDMGGYYTSDNKRFRVGAVIRNLGAQIKRFDDAEDHERLNTDMRIGLSYKAEYAPFRITATLKDIFHWDLSPDRNNKISFADNLFRHTIIGIEFVPSERIFAAFGYNHRVRRENRDSSVGGAAGLSWGLGFRVAKFDISYGMGKYHTAGAANSITIATNFDRFVK